MLLRLGDPSRSSTISRFLPHLIHGAGSLALIAGSYSQSGQCPGRLEARSEACSALSLKPKQDYLFNFPSNSLNIDYMLYYRHCFVMKSLCDFPFVMRVYAPRFFVSSQQKFGVTDIKAPWRVKALGGQTVL